MSLKEQAFTFRGALQLLEERARPELEPQELAFLGKAIHAAELQSKNAAKVAEGLAVLIADDERTGAFRTDADRPELLFHLSESVAQAAALAELGSLSMEGAGSADGLAPFTVGAGVQLLMDRAAPGLLEEERRYLEGATDAAALQAHHAAKVAEGIGCLIANDKSTGALQSPEDLSALLFHFAETFAQVGALAELGSLAAEGRTLPAAPMRAKRRSSGGPKA
jgi:hypothetical protein